MRFAVLADQTRAVDCEHDGQLLQADIVQNLIVTAL